MSKSSSRSAHLRVTELTGGRLTVRGENFSLGEFVREHADKSVTYLAQAKSEQLLARIFDRRVGKQSSHLEEVAVPQSRGLARYDLIGDATVSKGPAQVLGSAWATVRQYAPNTLADFLIEHPRSRPSTDKTARDMATDIAFGLQALHLNGLTHGDLRPSNIAFFQNTDIRLVDYGVAVGTDEVRLPDEMAKYASPEQLSAIRKPTDSSDVYSFGKVIRVLLKVSRHSDPSERQLLSWIVDECLSTSPQDRPSLANVIALLEDSSAGTEAQAYSQLRQAVIADIDGRVPDLLDRHMRSVARAAKNATEVVARDVARYSVYRMSGLTELEIVHLLSTVAIASLPAFVTGIRNRSNSAIINAVEHSPTHSLSELIGATNSTHTRVGQSETVIDDEWKWELRNIVVDGLESDQPSESQNALAENQIANAAVLRGEILASDVFVRSEDVAAIMSQSCPGISVEEVRILREMGYLVSLPDQGAFLYPLFQFHASTGLPYACVKTVSDLMEGSGSPWKRNIWWFLPTPRLDSKSPMAWLRSRGAEAEVTALFVERYVA